MMMRKSSAELIAAGKPSGTVKQIKEEGDIKIQSNKGNTIKKNASPDNPVCSCVCTDCTLI